jgi:hypothetical protein
MSFQRIALFVCFWSLSGSVLGSAEISRIGLFVGINEASGKGTLRYATTDALSMARVMEELGGIQKGNSHVKIGPSRASLFSEFESIRKKIRLRRMKRVEFLFYYSGHSDESGLLLGSERVDYSVLRDRVRGLNADVTVIVLDSCASGHFTRLKGGVKVPPFLTDGTSKLKGYVALTSSSLNEVAQESDRIRGSYFTHFLISGMRGAADVLPNRQITLSEAYQYAYHETLFRTEQSVGGAQHPSYSIQLSGSGELVMTDLRKSATQVVLTEDVTGRLAFFDSSDRMALEVHKKVSKPMEVALEPGTYTVYRFEGDHQSKARAEIVERRPLRISLSAFETLKPDEAVPRGGSLVSEDSVVATGLGFSKWEGFLGTDIALPIRGGSLNPANGMRSVSVGVERALSPTNYFGGFLGVRNFIYLGLEGGWRPFPYSKWVQWQLFGGLSTYSWSTGQGFGVVASPEEVMGTLHAGTRVSFRLAPPVGLYTSLRANFFSIFWEMGIRLSL